jgi:hypothetical protein
MDLVLQLWWWKTQELISQVIVRMQTLIIISSFEYSICWLLPTDIGC